MYNQPPTASWMAHSSSLLNQSTQTQTCIQTMIISPMAPQTIFFCKGNSSHLHLCCRTPATWILRRHPTPLRLQPQWLSTNHFMKQYLLPFRHQTTSPSTIRSTRPQDTTLISIVTCSIKAPFAVFQHQPWVDLEMISSPTIAGSSPVSYTHLTLPTILLV